jgi:predicted phage terminase large subunit-like protein
MRYDAKYAIAHSFSSFVRKAFYYDHGNKPGNEAYIDLLCHELEQLAKGKTKRLVINLPPRHLKSFLGAVYLAAWVLAHNPSARIMVLTYSEKLAERTTYRIRRILQSPWFKEIFETRVAEDRSRKDDFGTTNGGEVYATSINGGLAGRGADFIIFDDPLDLKDAGNTKQVELINQRFDSLVLSRLNDPRTGRVLIIAHRLNEDDLSAHVRKQGGWRHVVLPLIAPRTKKYDLGYSTWKRKRGELLRRASHTPKQLKTLRQTINPPYELYYQQGVSELKISIKADHFVTSTPPSIKRLPIVLSVDPGQRGGPTNSYSVIQAWYRHGERHCLIEQWREQCDFNGLYDGFRALVRHMRPAVVLIEATANGPALVAYANRNASLQVFEVVPDSRSKAERLLPHVPFIRKGGICLPANATWLDAYRNEFVDFPSCPYDDQIDATVQYLDWAAVHPSPDLPPERVIGVGLHSSGAPFGCGRNIETIEGPGICMARYRR